MSQPEGTAAKGCILTIGILSAIDACAVVLPIYTDSGTIEADTLCTLAADAAEENLLPAFCDCMSEDAKVLYIQCEGMVDGYVPRRKDFTPLDHPGTLSADIVPNNAAGLIVWYRDPADSSLGASRMRVAKNFIPGVPKDQCMGGVVQATLKANLQTFGALCLDGWDFMDGGADKFYRALAAAKPRELGTSIVRIVSPQARGYVATQKRRMVPRLF